MKAITIFDIYESGTGGDGSGNWCKELLNIIMQNTPHSWSDHTLQCFPPTLSEFFMQNSIPKEDKQQIKVWTLLLQYF